MRTIAIEKLIPDTVDVCGALDFDERGSGLAPRRLPAWTRLQMPAVMDAMVRMPSGVRLRFATDSRRVGVHFLATSIKTGINVVNMDSMRERVFVPALHGFLDTIREGNPDVPIIAISPIYCPSAETRPGPTVPNDDGKFVTIEGFEAYRVGCLSLSRIREIVAEAVAARRAAGDVNLHYVDGLDLFGEADADDLPDDLHPNPAGYERMGERFAPTLSRILDGP